jgi:hypothetical protein
VRLVEGAIEVFDENVEIEHGIGLFAANRRIF